MRIGVDVGGTNTDAVIMDGKTVLASIKSPTTRDISSGVVSAISEVLTASNIPATDIQAVMIGTTHFINAFVERKHLSRIGVIRLSLPANSSVPPLSDWPDDLRSELGEHVYMVKGGNNFDSRPISELDETAVREAAQRMSSSGVKSVALSAAFSPASPQMELRAEAIVREVIPDVCVTLSHNIGVVGLLARENAAIMNATLMALSGYVISGFSEALGKLGIEAPFYISQNDGTLMSPEFARQYPILTFASGATNSMRGAHFLSGEANAIVADIGGTTTDVGALVKGYPRESSSVVDIGGVCTNFRMPDAISIGLGGGSKIIVDSNDPDSLTIGPQSVGYEIQQKSKIFGGDTLTATDIAVAAGYVELGDASYVSSLDDTITQIAVDQIHTMIGDTLDRMKLGSGTVPLILVGGGSILVSKNIEGASRVIKPPHSEVANAVGAAIAQVGAEVEHVVYCDVVGRDTAIAQAKEEVSQRVIAAGGDAASVEIIDIEEVQLAYMPGNTVKLRVRAVADLALNSSYIQLQ